MITKKDIESFTVRQVRDFEGCPMAMRHLMKTLGDTVYDLSTSQKVVQDLIEDDDKVDWAINFMLNLMKPKYRLEFYFKYLEEALIHIEDQEIKDYIHLSFISFSKRISAKSLKVMAHKMDVIYAHIGASLNDQKDESIRNKLLYELEVLNSMKFFIDDEDKKFTRNITDGLMKLAEAKVYRNFVQYPYQDNIKQIAESLMEFTEVWKKS